MSLEPCCNYFHTTNYTILIIIEESHQQTYYYYYDFSVLTTHIIKVITRNTCLL